MRRAGFWHRAAAAALDAVVLVLGAVAVAALLYLGGAPDEWFDSAGGFVGTMLVLAYTSTEVWLAATPGKLLLGLRISTAEGGTAGRWSLALRWSAKYYGVFPVAMSAVTGNVAFEYLGGFMNNVVLVGCLQALGEDRRAWHDEWAVPAVVRRSAPAVPPPLPAT